MARKAKRKSAAKTKAGAKRTQARTPKRGARRAPVAVHPTSGPVTLEEAQALAAARRPRRALRRAVAPEPTPADLGLERQELEKARDDERERRRREYADTIKIMKQRGARAADGKADAGGRRRAPGAKAEGRRRALAAKAPAFQPLQVVAEGDSWFDYPYPLFGGGIIPRLQKLLGVPILNLADAGDEVRFMLGVKQRKRLIKTLQEGSPGGGPWDAMLFSGGGNDIVDNPMALWVIDWNPGIPPANHINQPRFDAALALVRSGYEDLIMLRNTLSPTTHLVFHCYDFAIPDGRGVCNLGPWLKPTFDLRHFPDRPSASAVVVAMLTQFANMLAKVAASQPNVTVINGQGTLAPQPSAWHNELHPDKAGFKAFAQLFYTHLNGLFPTRVA